MTSVKNAAGFFSFVYFFCVKRSDACCLDFCRWSGKQTNTKVSKFFFLLLINYRAISPVLFVVYSSGKYFSILWCFTTVQFVCKTPLFPWSSGEVITCQLIIAQNFILKNHISERKNISYCIFPRGHANLRCKLINSQSTLPSKEIGSILYHFLN